MDQKTFWVVALPHTDTTLELEADAYQSKCRKFCNMMKSLGHKVYLFSGERNEADCDEHFPVFTDEKRREWFPQVDWHKNFFPITWDPTEAHWVEGNNAVIEILKDRIQPRDFICVIAGRCHEQIAQAFPNHMTVEFGIGYTGVFSSYKVFESYSHMHYCYGDVHDDNGKFYDTVIPNYFEIDNFPVNLEKDDYFLFLGRFINRKGVSIAAEVTKRIGAKLVVAGQGAQVQDDMLLGEDVMIQGDHIEHFGFADFRQRAELLSHAKATFMPTTYLEPFGGVSVESLLCGTPVIATDFGAFSENIRHGIDGYRFRTIGEAIWAAQNLSQLDNARIAEDSRNNFSTDRIKMLYQAYFEQLDTLWGEGFYSDWDKGVSEYERYRRI